MYYSAKQPLVGDQIQVRFIAQISCYLLPISFIQLMDDICVRITSLSITGGDHLLFDQEKFFPLFGRSARLLPKAKLLKAAIAQHILTTIEQNISDIKNSSLIINFHR